jgi:hypothetical protein
MNSELNQSANGRVANQNEGDEEKRVGLDRGRPSHGSGF